MKKSIHGKLKIDTKGLPRVFTVKDLLALLKKLPPNLKINGDKGLKPVWFNVGVNAEDVQGEHLDLEDTDVWDDEE